MLTEQDKQQIGDIRDFIDRYSDLQNFERLIERLNQSETDLATAVRLLRMCEWGDYNDKDGATCPVCYMAAWAAKTHTEDCRLAAFLAKYPTKV